MSPSSLRVKASVLPGAGKASGLPLLISLWPYCYLSLLVPSAPAILSPLLLLTCALIQGLCTCSAPLLCLESCSSGYLPGSVPYFSRSLRKCHLLKKSFSEDSFLNFTSTSHTHSPALYGPSLFSSTPWPRHPQVQPNKDLPPPSQPRTRHRYPLTTAQVTIWVLHSCAKAAP